MKWKRSGRGLRDTLSNEQSSNPRQSTTNLEDEASNCHEDTKGTKYRHSKSYPEPPNRGIRRRYDMKLTPACGKKYVTSRQVFVGYSSGIHVEYH